MRVANRRTGERRIANLRRLRSSIGMTMGRWIASDVSILLRGKRHVRADQIGGFR